MPAGTPTDLQRTLTLTYDRGQQLAALRDLRVGNGHAKHVLRVLDDHIGNGKHSPEQRSGKVPPDFSWSISVDDLATECEVSRATAFRALRHLEETGFIRWPAKHGLKPRFTICWTVIFGAEVVSNRDNSSDQNGPELSHPETTCTEGELSHPETRCLTERQPLSQPEKSCLILRLHNMNKRPISAPVSANQAPPSSGTPSAGDGGDQEILDQEAVTKIVRQAGVARAAEKVQQAIAVGMSLQQIADVAEHALRYHGRWSGGIVADRLTQADAPTLAADEGWYGDDPRWIERERERKAAERRSAPEPESRQTKLERRFGEQLNAASDVELAEIIASLSQYEQSRAAKIIAAGTDICRSSMRVDLLEAVARLQTAMANTS